MFKEIEVERKIREINLLINLQKKSLFVKNLRAIDISLSLKRLSCEFVRN